MATTNQNANRLSEMTAAPPSVAVMVMMLGDVSARGIRKNERWTVEWEVVAVRSLSVP